jgi:hypothetical protein
MLAKMRSVYIHVKKTAHTAMTVQGIVTLSYPFAEKASAKVLETAIVRINHT